MDSLFFQRFVLCHTLVHLYLNSVSSSNTIGYNMYYPRYYYGTNFLYGSVCWGYSGCVPTCGWSLRLLSSQDLIDIDIANVDDVKVNKRHFTAQSTSYNEDLSKERNCARIDIELEHPYYGGPYYPSIDIRFTYVCRPNNYDCFYAMSPAPTTTTTRAPTTTTPAPTTTTSPAQTTTPAPTTTTSAPTMTTPDPTTTTPAPTTTTTPAPTTTTTPAPTMATPAQTTTTLAQTTTPAPTTKTPAPTMMTLAQTTTALAQTTITLAQTTTPAQTTTTPAPTLMTPAPTMTTLAQTTTALAQTTITLAQTTTPAPTTTTQAPTMTTPAQITTTPAQTTTTPAQTRTSAPTMTTPAPTTTTRTGTPVPLYPGQYTTVATQIALRKINGDCYEGSQLSTLSGVSNVLVCSSKCISHKGCVGINFWKSSARCDLAREESEASLGFVTDCQYYQMVWKASG